LRGSADDYARLGTGQLDRIRQAGSIAARVLRDAALMVRPGVRALEVCITVEREIIEAGARPAFPCNIGIDSIAAHYTATPGDDEEVRYGSIVKIDIGVELDGYIVDTAISLDLRSSHGYLVDVAQEALRNALAVARSGVKVGEIGAVIYESTVRRGCRPISNLSGHEIRRYNLHAGVSIPNVPSPDASRLEAGHVYAVEPFITLQQAQGVVVNTRRVSIYSVKDAALRIKSLSREEREALEVIMGASRGLPYTPRWLDEHTASIHDRLYRRGLVHGYPVLVEKSGAPVAQAEHTILVYEDGCEVLTAF